LYLGIKFSKLGTDHLTSRRGEKGYVFFVKKISSDNTRVRILFFFPEFNIRLYDKNSESEFFFLHQNQNIFFHFKYGDKELEIVKDFLYLGIKFSKLGTDHLTSRRGEEGYVFFLKKILASVPLFTSSFLALLRDRPFILEEGLWVMVFCFVQKFVFGQHES
jgi:hypothetical protein